MPITDCSQRPPSPFQTGPRPDPKNLTRAAADLRGWAAAWGTWTPPECDRIIAAWEGLSPADPNQATVINLIGDWGDQTYAAACAMLSGLAKVFPSGPGAARAMTEPTKPPPPPFGHP